MKVRKEMCVDSAFRSTASSGRWEKKGVDFSSPDLSIDWAIKCIDRNNHHDALHRCRKGGARLQAIQVVPCEKRAVQLLLAAWWDMPCKMCSRLSFPPFHSPALKFDTPFETKATEQTLSTMLGQQR